MDRGEEKTSSNRLMKVKSPSRKPDSWNQARSRPTDHLKNYRGLSCDRHFTMKLLELEKSVGHEINKVIIPLQY